MQSNPAIEGQPRRGRKILRTAASAALIAATFGFAIPHFASYHSVWASIHAMTWPHALLIATAAAASMVSYWITIRTVLPSLRLRQAAAVNLGSNAVANTLPAGGALAMGVSWAMLSSWGLSAADYVLYTLVTGIWNVFTLLGMPVVALLVLATATRPDAALITAAAAGLAVLAAMATGLGLLLRSQAFALRAGRALQRPLAIASRVARRPPPADAAGSLSGFRDRAGARSPLAAGGSPPPRWPATSPCGSSCWHACAAPACPRPKCPGRRPSPPSRSSGCSPPFRHPRRRRDHRTRPGGILAAGADHTASVQVTAAVLLYRAVTFLPPSRSAPSPASLGGSPPLSSAPAHATPTRQARTAMTPPASPSECHHQTRPATTCPASTGTRAAGAVPEPEGARR